MTKAEIVRSEAIAYIADSLVTGMTAPQIYNALKEAKITRTPKQSFTHTQVRDMIEEVHLSWQEASNVSVEDARISQLREIQLMKKRLHAMGVKGYKDLATLLKLEAQITGTATNKQAQIAGQLAVVAITSTERIAALESAREREEDIIGDYQVVNDQDYVDSVTV